MLKRLFLFLVVAVLGVLGLAATKPDRYTVQRATTVAAPPDRLAALVADFHAWSQWSPWEKLDPAMKRHFSGPASGPGAGYAWEGNKDVGRGAMQIVEASPQRVVVALEFVEPFPSRNTSTFDFAPADGGRTRVTWTMAGPMDFMTKVMDTVVGMDRMIGKDFEQGLANLQRVAEAR